MLDEKLLVFVLGAPGAGKGTQSDLIVKEYGWAHFSAGDLLRAEVQAGTEAGKQAEEYLKAGTMVPASMIIGLLKQAVYNTKHGKVLIDGFPRVLDQLKEFEQEVRPCDKALFYNVPEEAAKERLLKRGESSGRIDDNEETINNRFKVFKQESMPVITELESEGRVVEINAAQTPEQVFAQTRQVIEQLEQQLASKQSKPQDPAAAAAADAEAAAAPAKAEAAAVPAAAAAAGGAAASPAVQSPRASTTPVAVSPVAAAAAAASPTPASPQAAAAAVSPAAVGSPAAAQGSTEAVVAPAALTALTAAAAAAAAGATAAATAAGSPAQPAVASPTAAGAVSPSAAAAAAAASSSPVKPAAEAAPAAAAESPVKVESVAPVAVPPPGVPASLDVTSPTAAGSVLVSPSPRATLASLQVDLSGIRTPIIICGPSGVGKGTLINLLMAQHPERFGFSVSHTTRGPRPGEVHGKHYYFTDREAMSAQVASGMFLEHADVHGNMYGTSLAAVAQVSAAGKHCVLDIDVQGAAQVRKSALGAHCLFIFVAPPSHEELERRLRNRGTETEDKVLQRLANAESEIAKAQEPGLFHHVLVNAELEPAYQELQKLIARRVPGLIPRSSESGTASKRASEAGATAGTPTASAGPSAANTPVATGAAAGAVPAAVAGTVAVAAAATAAAALGGISSPRSQQQSPQQQQQQQPHPLLANGNISTSAAPAAAAGGGTATLLDFGFGASAGPAAAAKGMPVRQYMDATVIPVLREGLKALNAARPDDPLQFLADYLVAHKAAAA